MVCQVFTGPLMSSSGPSTKQPLNKDFLSLYNANANKISIFPLQLKRIQWGGVTLECCLESNIIHLYLAFN